MITDLTRRATIHDASLAWDRWGGDAGVPFWLCHGYSGSSHDFALAIEHFAESRPVIALDHRGHGRSQKFGTVDAYSVDQLAADLIAAIDAHAGDQIDLLGHSMGGAISLRVTLTRPDLVRSLVLMDTSAWSFVPEDPAMADMMRAFLGAFDPAGGLPDLTMLDGPETAMIAAATPAEWQAIANDLSAGFDPYAMKALGGDLFGDSISVRDRLGEIRCPVSVVVGELDAPFIGQAADLAASFADGALTVIPGAYHSPQLTHPAEWTAAIDAHLARV
ncbi:MAG: putative 3-oxoadipate enol-lactone hydrolase [Actinomycetota bacterium]